MKEMDVTNLENEELVELLEILKGMNEELDKEEKGDKNE